MLVGIFGVVRSRNLIHTVVCVSVAQSGTYVLLLAIGYQRGACGTDLRLQHTSRARRWSTRSCRP